MLESDDEGSSDSDGSLADAELDESDGSESSFFLDRRCLLRLALLAFFEALALLALFSSSFALASSASSFLSFWRTFRACFFFLRRSALAIWRTSTSGTLLLSSVSVSSFGGRAIRGASLLRHSSLRPPTNSLPRTG